jgi:hypothetical protein
VPDVDVVEIVNVIAVCVEAFWSVTDSDMNVEVALGVSTHGVDAGGKTGDCDGGGCPKGLQFPSVATKSHAVGVGIDGGGRGFPMDFVRPIEDLIGRGEDGLREPEGRAR